MGSEAWLEARGVGSRLREEALTTINPPPHIGGYEGSSVHVVMDGKYRGHFALTSAVRTATDKLIAGLSSDCTVGWVSGDNEKERERFATKVRSTN